MQPASSRTEKLPRVVLTFSTHAENFAWFDAQLSL
jgi:hypothetical protein